MLRPRVLQPQLDLLTVILVRAFAQLPQDLFGDATVACAVFQLPHQTILPPLDIPGPSLCGQRPFSHLIQEDINDRLSLRGWQ